MTDEPAVPHRVDDACREGQGVDAPGTRPRSGAEGEMPVAFEAAVGRGEVSPTRVPEKRAAVARSHATPVPSVAAGAHEVRVRENRADVGGPDDRGDLHTCTVGDRRFGARRNDSGAGWRP